MLNHVFQVGSHVFDLAKSLAQAIGQNEKCEENAMNVDLIIKVVNSDYSSDGSDSIRF